MFYLSRAAKLAVATLGAVMLMGTTTAGAAHDLDHAPFTSLNALVAQEVPTIEAQVIPDKQPAVVAADEPDFDTLAQAVAAQSAGADDAELKCLAAGVFYESHGEPLAGQLAVAQTILNRTRSGRFPASVCSVLTQRGQFSFVRGGVVPTAEGRNGWTTAVAVAKVAARDLWDGAADEALYFHARRIAPGARMQRIAAIGNHVFYR